MSDAGTVVRDGLIAALTKRRELMGVDGLDDDTSVSALPRVTVDPPDLSDWGTKSTRGREVRTTVSVRVARGQRLRLPMMTAAVEATGEALRGDIGGWSIASAVLTRTRVIDQSDGTRVAQIEHRIRILEV